VVNVTENNAEEDDLPAKPEYLNQHPEEEVGFEAHFANERIPEHYGINLDVTPHRFSLSYRYCRLPGAATFT
jgi:hypothetical protein